MDFEKLITDRLTKRANQGIFRTLTIGHPAIDFSSNDYLGLARSPELFRRIDEKVKMLPVRNGSTGSRLLSGNTSYTEAVEHQLSAIFKSESALLYNSGYTANLGVISALAQRNDIVLFDERSHASIKDAVRLSLAKHYPFRHNDLGDLSQKLKRSSGQVFIVVEGVYSMDGDTCPLGEVIELAEKFNACIILDEAHSTGVMGEKGGGLAVWKGVEKKIDVRIHTFGKAMGVHGACVAGSEKLKEYLINFSRPFIYTTALSPHAVVSIAEAFSFLEHNPHLPSELEERIRLFCDGMKGFYPSQHKTAIQPVIIGDAKKTRSLGAELQASGLDVRAIVSPTVPLGEERLRICLHTYNSKEDIQTLVSCLTGILDKKN